MSKRGRRNVSGLAALGSLGAALMLAKRGKGVDLSEPKKPAVQEEPVLPKKPRVFEEAETFPIDGESPVSEQPLKDAYSPYKKGGSVKSSASKRADGCAQRGRTKGRIV